MTNKRLIGISGKSKSGKDLLGDIIQFVDGEHYNVTSFKDWKGGMPKYPNSDRTYKRKKFADKLKEIASLMTGISRKDLERQEVKASTIGEITGDPWIRYRIRVEEMHLDSTDVETRFLSELFTDVEQAREFADSYHRRSYDILKKNVIKEDLTVRDLLQYIGTEAFRKTIHPDSWVKASFADYEENSKWLFTDMRFPNELFRVREEDGITIRINRPIESRFPKLYNGFMMMKDDYNTFQSFLLNKYPDMYKYINHESEIALDSYRGKFHHIIENTKDIDFLINRIKSILNKK